MSNPRERTLTRRSTLGKHRSVTDAKIVEILAWHNATLSNRQKALELGIAAEIASSMAWC
jgi:hypothetical protein